MGHKVELDGAPERATPRARPLILIVEDQPDLRALYVQHLSISGFDVIEAVNGADAVTFTTAQNPDVVLMDLSLPVIDGWEATRRLKSDSRTAHIPVVALTAHDGAGETTEPVERATPVVSTSGVCAAGVAATE